MSAVLRHVWHGRFVTLITEWDPIIFLMARQPLLGLGFLYDVSRGHSIRHITLGRTPLDNGLVRHIDLYLTTHNTHKRQTFMSPAGFEPAKPAGVWP